jgi:drug/metabolite transporter (DMT)-like permease
VIAPATIAIVLVAAVAHAIWNTASKYKQGDTVRFVWAYTAASAVLCVPIAAVRMIVDGQQVTLALVIGAAVSGALHVAYSMSLQTGYDKSDLGVVYPVARGTGPILTMLCAILFLGERLSILEIVGAVVVVLGITVVAGNPFAPGRTHPLRGVGWGALTGATIAAYTLWDDHSVATLHLDPMAYFAGTLVFETAILAPRALRNGFRPVLDVVRRNPVPVPVIAVFSPLAYVLVLIAMQTAPVAIVAPLRESSIVLGSLLAWRLFHEGHLPRRLIGAVVVLAGIAAISV